MNNGYRRSQSRKSRAQHSLLNIRYSRLLFAAFVLFIAYKILTPPKTEIARKESPDGSKTARLHRVAYYENQPSYKIYYRDTGKRAWLGLMYLPAYTNIPPETHQPDIEWSPDSEVLFFSMNGTNLWHHLFKQ